MSNHPRYLKRASDSLLACNYGISYLDDAFRGIRPCDLVVIAAKTGTGKTQLGCHIALHNARKGKRVYFIALEAEQYEIENRLAYQILAQKFFTNRDKYPATTKLDYEGYLYCAYPELKELEDEVDNEMPFHLDNLEIYQPGISNFSKQDFGLVYEDVAQKKCDLIILDHVHYLAAEDRENEYDHIKKTMWKLRELIYKYRVPVIAFSHLRKEDKFNKTYVPLLEDLHGSSEISKQANTVISFAEAYEVPSKDDPKKTMIKLSDGETFCKVLKARVGAPRIQKYIGLIRFDLDTTKYEDKYVPYRTNSSSTELTPMRYQDFERWMSMARESK